MEVGKIKIIGAYIIIGILLIMMVLCGISYVVPKIVKKFDINSEYINNLFNLNKAETIKVDWKEEYKFEEESIKEDIKKISKKSLMDKYKGEVNSIVNKLEDYTSEKLIKYNNILELSYIYDHLSKYSLVSNSSKVSRIEMGEGYLTRLVPEFGVEESANRLIEFNEYLKDKDINFIYVQAPYKISGEEAKNISTIYKDYSNTNLNNLINLIDDKVDYIDIRSNIKKENLSHLDLFYKTDHHWLPETGLWATYRISEYLNKNYNMNLVLENSNINNYTKNTYEKIFLGADGKYVTLANTQPEDFNLLIPNFETKLEVKIPDANVDKIGAYAETLIEYRLIDKTDYYNLDPYGAYLYGNKALIEVHNQLIQNDKKILIVRDSFSNVVIPFLALETEYVSAIDLRYFTGSLKTYIKQYQPDMVIVMYTGNHYAGYSSGTNALWEFE